MSSHFSKATSLFPAPSTGALELLSFEEYRSKFSLRFARVTSIAAAVLMPAGTTVDILVYPEFVTQFLLIRCVASAVCLALFGLSFARIGIRHPVYIGALSIFAAAIAMEVMIELSGGYKSPYYAGLTLCIVAFALAFFWEVWQVALFSSATIALWAVPSVLARPIDDFALFYNNLYFMVINALAMLAFTGARANTMRRDYYAQQELRKTYSKLSELDRLKSQFFANVSHELRTPLTLSMGPVEAVLRSGELKGTTMQSLESAHRYQMKLATLINDLLAFSKLEAGKEQAVFQAIPLVQFLKKQMEGFVANAPQRGIAITQRLPPEEVEIWADRNKLDRMTINLLSNAFKFTPSGGRITVESRADDDEVVFIVGDTGPGIPLSKLESIFDRFSQVDASVTRTHEGTGIGLAMVKEYAEMHGGSVTVESEVGKGSTFILRLPRRTGPMSGVRLSNDDQCHEQRIVDLHVPRDNDDSDAVLDRTVAENNDRVELARFAEDVENQLQVTQRRLSDRKPVVLVVDDQSDMRGYIRSLLEDNYQVISAKDGQQGLEFAERAHPDVIVSDVMMPRLSGDKLVREIRSRSGRLGSTPIVLVTARADQESRIDGLSLRADEYLYKPFSAEELKLRVRNLVEKRLQEDTLRQVQLDLSEKQRRIDEDLDVARRFQSCVLRPLNLPSPFQGHVEFHPMGQVGGDFYHVTSLHEGVMRILLGDITGHGVQAALRMIATFAEYTRLPHDELQPDQVLVHLNELLIRKYVDLSGCFLCLDLQLASNGVMSLTYAQAGPAPLGRLSPAGFVELPASDTLPAGILPGAQFSLVSAEVPEGQTLFLYTDGILEQQNVYDEEFGAMRLADAIANTAANTTDTISNATGDVMDAVRSFQGAKEQGDDISIIGIGVV